LQGASEAQDPSLTPVQKMRMAHSRITLIIDDAMRGLADAHDIMFERGISLGLDIAGAISAAEDAEDTTT